MPVKTFLGKTKRKFALRLKEGKFPWMEWSRRVFTSSMNCRMESSYSDVNEIYQTLTPFKRVKIRRVLTKTQTIPHKRHMSFEI